MISKYTITNPYGEGNTKFNEVQIESDGLIYTEIGNAYYGLQCSKLSNINLIREKCIQVANLIREIDELNYSK